MLQATQFLVDLDIFAVAAVTNENGSFRPHLPNNDIVCKTFSRGDILEEARPLSEVRFISDSNAVSAVANTPPPRGHTSQEKLSILKGIHERMSQWDVPASRRAEYVRLLAEFEDTISADQEDRLYRRDSA